METIYWKPWTAEKRKEQVCSAPSEISTYRKGTKWVRPDLVGQRVRLVDEKNDRMFATAKFKSVKLTTFADLEETDHGRQTSEMTPERRLEVMRSVYGDYDENTLTAVVVLSEIKVVPGTCD